MSGTRMSARASAESVRASARPSAASVPASARPSAYVSISNLAFAFFENAFFENAFFENAFFENAFFVNFANFWRARSRLYQNEILQENMRSTAFFKLYKICILLHRCNLNFFAKNRFEKLRISQNF